MGGSVVIGLGNPLMADDGVGIAALDLLRLRGAPRGVELVDGGTWGLTLLPVIEAAERVLFIDAIAGGGAPGTLYVLEGAQLPRYLRTKVSPHQVDLCEVLALAELRGTLPLETVAFGLQPEVIEMSYGLSDSVFARLDELVDAVVERISPWSGKVIATNDTRRRVF